MFKNTPNSIYRRKVIFFMLSESYENKTILDAIIVWEKNFGSNESLLANIMEYTRILKDKLNIESDNDQFRTSYINNLIIKKKEIDDLYDPVNMAKRIFEKNQDIYSANESPIV